MLCLSWRTLGLALLFTTITAASPAQRIGTGNVIFLHPDGTGANHWGAARIFYEGPDGSLNWDRMPHMAFYRGHMKDQLTGTSNGGATVHAFGYKVEGPGSFGKDGDGNRNPPTDRFIRSLSGFAGSIMREAGSKGHPIGVVNDGHLGEPGTGAFLAEVGNRNNWDEIVLQMLKGRPGKNDPQPQVLLGGGERNFLPEGVTGVYGPGARKDGRNLVQEARADGYLVIQTRTEFDALMGRLRAEPNFTPKVLGLFASFHIMNDADEEKLIADGLVNPSIPASAKTGNLILWGGKPGTPGFNPPTFAEMSEMAILILDRASQQARKGFFLVAEPESCDNFGNSSNAIGTLESVRRADDAIGVFQSFIARRPRTLLLTAADSDANGIQLVSVRRAADGSIPNVGGNAANQATGLPAITAPYDGVFGRNTRAFEAEPDQFGQRLLFGIAWAGGGDFAGGVLSRAQGLNASLLTTRFSERFDSADVYRMIHASLFGRLLDYPQGKQAPSP